MGIGALAQVAVDLFLGLGLFICAMRIARAPKDDPRLSRGLQLLQSKIAVLEDLADKSEAHAQHLSALLEQKSLDVQSRIEEAERHVQAIKASMQRSLEVAKIFEDKIPHHEIIERQNAAKYVTAARLAHEGRDLDEIARRVDLPRGEIEFIAKVNKDRLMFSEAQLPWWAGERDGVEFAPEASPAFSPPPAAEAPLIAYVPPPESAAASLERLGEEFRRACMQAGLAAPEERPEASAASAPPLAAPHVPAVEAKPGPVVRLVEFPRIASVRPTDNLR